MLQEVVALNKWHKEQLAAAARSHEEAVQVQQRDAKEQLAEQARAIASARSALQAANAASSQASQVCYSSLAAPGTFQCGASAGRPYLCQAPSMKPIWHGGPSTPVFSHLPPPPAPVLVPFLLVVSRGQYTM